MDKLLLKRLTQEFYLQPTLEVAKQLIGKILVFNEFSGIITETEAYIGKDDPACHASRGKTPRTEVMFKAGGYSYVYFIYGMYYCLNFVTEEEGFPSAVLIRGIKLLNTPYTHLNGPGKLCRFLGINKEQNNIDIINSKNFYVADLGHKVDFSISTRIGIKLGNDLPWRFLAKDIF